jgi:N-acetylglucosamine kinase-like BadF-type ATPase
MFKLGRPTIMREMLFELLGITRKEDYLDVITEKFYDSSLDSVAVNSVVFNAAALDDAVAMGILEESAEQYAGGIARLAMDLDFPADRTLYVTLAGSVFVKQKVKILQDLIALRVQEALGGRNVEYLQLEAPPVAGAVMWAAQKACFDVEMDTIKAGLIAAGL